MNRSLIRYSLALFLAGCGSSTPSETTTPAKTTASEAPPVAAAPAKEAPPASSTARDIKFPTIHHVALANGLNIDVVTKKELPIINLELVIQSGGAVEPKELQGLASIVADMLKEGTKKKNAAQFAEAIEFLGSQMSTAAGAETLRVRMNAMSEHLEPALALMSEAVLTPAFDAKELEKLKTRTIDELKLKMDRPAWLARRQFQRDLYGEHPYAQYDTTEAAVKKVKRTDLLSYHAAHFVPNNAFLVVVGDVTPEEVKEAADKLFGKWKAKEVAEPTYAAPPARDKREIVVIDRPASVQSQIMIGNLALKRNDPDFISLMVANQVLGGSAASRLFMDLREKRSLTYGAYSRVDESPDLGAFRATAAVRNPVTGEALEGFFEHLTRITREPAPADELDAAHRYLADSFPLQIETLDSIAQLVADIRVFGLKDDYWDTFRTNIRNVDADSALKAAKEHILPDQSLVVIVGKAAEIVPMLTKFGTVRVVDAEGKPVRASDAPAPAAAAAPAEKPGKSGAPAAPVAKPEDPKAPAKSAPNP